MGSGLSNQPRLLKGALVDSNVLAFPPLIVPFQFNPDKLTRRRSVRVQSPRSRQGREETTPEAESLGETQTTLTNPETITLDVRLDATDALEAGDPLAGEFGVLPALSALEMMITPRAESLFGGVLGLSANFGFGDRQSTPVLIFVWGRQRIYPVRLTDVNIQEVEFNPNLNPTRVIAGISMQVLSGSNPFFIFTQAQRELLAATNLIAAPDLARSVFNLG
jgi:hypothetical protein